MDTKQIIRKWYGLLEFPKKYDKAFEEALNRYDIGEETCIEEYDVYGADGERNLLSCLYMCERAEQLYKEKNISHDIFLDTMKDIPVWTDIYTRVHGYMYLGELQWLRQHLTCKLFKLGRLQFAFGKAHCDYPKFHMKNGDPVIEVHIDNRGPLLPEACDDSFLMADEFFRTYFPEYHYDVYTCHSWLLGNRMERLFPQNGNMQKFSHRFDIINEEPGDDILKYVFRWDASRQSVQNEKPENAFEEKIISEVKAGNLFYTGYGARRLQ